MAELLTEDIPYHHDSSILFDRVADEPWSIFLDSNQPTSNQGRYDIIVSRPKYRIQTTNKLTTIDTWSESLTERGDPFAILKEYLEPSTKLSSEYPFIGGAVGYFSYDLGRSIETLPNLSSNDLLLPDMMMGIYTWALIIDHKNKRATLLGDKHDTRTCRNWDELIRIFTSKLKAEDRSELNVKSDICSNMTKQQYEIAFKKIKNYIREGDCYQVNLAQRFQVKVDCDPWRTYQQLRKINASPFCAYMNFPEFQILSNSPERFLSVINDKVQTKPIKGTRPRSEDSQEDSLLMQELSISKKDQAENVMIVDLLRNDISKNCALGSVEVPKLFDIESFPNVHHLVSTITGKLRKHRSSIDLLKGCFPGGSITGAPKLRSMEIIEELEPHRRGIYCGSIGYIGFDGNMDTNIAIRTIVHKDKHMYFYAGGGIVNDSNVDAEYQETFDKAASIMKLFNQGHDYAVGH